LEANGSSKTTEAARFLRRRSTLPERLLWDHLRNRRFNGLKFRRQHTFGPYVLDFYCAELKLAIELDGPYHLRTEQAARDSERTSYLEARGMRLMRFTNTAHR
jgi:very-short-patch-repair endonuclease